MTYAAMVGLLLLWATTSAAFAQQSIQIQTNNYVVDSEGAVDVAIDLESGNHSVAAFKIEVAYDPAIVTQTGCALQDFTGVCNESTAGQILIVGVNTNGIRGDLQIAKITFEPISLPGDRTPLTTTVLTLVDSAGTNLNSSTSPISDGTILIRLPETKLSESNQSESNQNRIYLPTVGRTSLNQGEGKQGNLTADQSLMKWICAFMHNFGWTSDSCERSI